MEELADLSEGRNDPCPDSGSRDYLCCPGSLLRGFADPCPIQVSEFPSVCSSAPVVSRLGQNWWELITAEAETPVHFRSPHYSSGFWADAKQQTWTFPLRGRHMPTLGSPPTCATLSQARARLHRHIYTRTRAHAYSPIHALTHARVCIHTYTRPCTGTAHMHTRTHTGTHVRLSCGSAVQVLSSATRMTSNLRFFSSRPPFPGPFPWPPGHPRQRSVIHHYILGHFQPSSVLGRPSNLLPQRKLTVVNPSSHEVPGTSRTWFLNSPAVRACESVWAPDESGKPSSGHSWCDNRLWGLRDAAPTSLLFLKTQEGNHSCTIFTAKLLPLHWP